MIEVILFDFGQTLEDSSEGFRTALAHRNLADGIKDRKFYRVGMIGHEPKRPQNLAAIPAQARPGRHVQSKALFSRQPTTREPPA